jgi:glucose-6-phosphate 1-dehydrogenase
MTRNAAATSVRPADPCCFVIFGASGDLTHRLLILALYNLAVGGLLPDPISIIGVGRTAVSSEDFRKDLMKSLHAFATRRLDDAIAKRLLDCITYVPSDSDDSKAYEMLSREIDRVQSCAKHAEIACSISRRRRRRSRRSGAASGSPDLRARKTAHGGASSSRSR